jgi:hypothetical protein
LNQYQSWFSCSPAGLLSKPSRMLVVLCTCSTQPSHIRTFTYEVILGVSKSQLAGSSLELILHNSPPRTPRLSTCSRVKGLETVDNREKKTRGSLACAALLPYAVIQSADVRTGHEWSTSVLEILLPKIRVL